jgi:hypothetical protein
MRVLETMMGLIISSISGLCIGCMADVSADKSLEETATTDQALITGVWAGPFSNGDAGPNPLVWGGMVPCENINADFRYHPGKLWDGTCRYEYGGGVVYEDSYYTLQFQSGMISIANPGFTPPSAFVGSSPGQLPVCYPYNYPQSTGKVWQGNCRFEWGDVAHIEPGFWFLGKQ